jgi:hypothetical protein
MKTTATQDVTWRVIRFTERQQSAAVTTLKPWRQKAVSNP